MSEIKNVTQADLIISAQEAALAARKLDALGRQKLKTERFEAAGFDALDYPMWETGFLAHLDALEALAKQDSPATVAAKKASQKQ